MILDFCVLVRCACLLLLSFAICCFGGLFFVDLGLGCCFTLLGWFVGWFIAVCCVLLPLFALSFGVYRYVSGFVFV